MTDATQKKSIAELYTPVVPDFEHQTVAKEKGARKWAFAYFMDQGTGKTKTTIDNACLLYRMRVIRAFLVLTPKDVGDQWAEEQLPQHVPKDIKTRVAVWDAASRRAQKECEALCKPLANRLHILIVNHEALATDRGRKLITKFLRAFPDATLTAVDESHEFKTPTALRTKFLNNTVRIMSKVHRPVWMSAAMSQPQAAALLQHIHELERALRGNKVHTVTMMCGCSYAMIGNEAPKHVVICPRHEGRNENEQGGAAAAGRASDGGEA